MIVYYYSIELHMGFYLVAVAQQKDTTYKNIHKYITQNNITLKQNASHKATQTIKDIK
jgi:hypothetical protein